MSICCLCAVPPSILSVLRSFLTGTTGFFSHRGCCFPDAVSGYWCICKIKCTCFGYGLCYSAGAVAPDLPVQKLLRPVFLVVITDCVIFMLFKGFPTLPKF